MRRATLIVNPKAGSAQRTDRMWREVEGVLRRNGFSVEVCETTSAPHSARDLAAGAAVRSEVVLACGGDGTVHGVLQGVANTGACLGVLPMGTANALARNLGLPMDPLAAIERLMEFAPREIPLCVARTEREERWFTVMAGAGPDGRLIHEMGQGRKVRMGRSGYYAEAARMFATRRFPAFGVSYRAAGSDAWTDVEAIGLMVSRIADLGGMFRGLTSESSLHHPHMVLKVLAAPAAVSLPMWFAMGRVGMSERNRWLRTVAVEEVRCWCERAGDEVHCQVDGEAMGAIPLRMGIAQRGLRMLMPLPAGPVRRGG